MATEIAYAKEKFDAIVRLHESARARCMSDEAIARLPKLPTYVKPIVLPPIVLATNESKRRRKARRKPLSEATKEKLRIKAKARWVENADYRARMTAILTERMKSPATRALVSKSMKRVWRTPAYREKMQSHLRNIHALSIEASRKYQNEKPKIRPPQGTPEGALYLKLRVALGPKAAREAMGITP